MKKEAEEREKANELKLAKKQEREQRRLLNEQKRRERESQEDGDTDELSAERRQKQDAAEAVDSKKNPNIGGKQRGLVATFCSLLFNVAFLLLVMAVVCLALSKYCVSNKRVLRATHTWLNSVYLKPTLNAVDANICPHLTTSAWRQILRKLNLIWG